jgi:hypothetical protein
VSSNVSTELDEVQRPEADKLFNRREPPMVEVIGRLTPLTPITRLVFQAWYSDNRPFVLATCFAEICKLKRIGHCAAYRTDYSWSDEYGLWLPDIRRSLFRRIFIEHFGEGLFERNQDDASMAPGPRTIESIIDFARGTDGVALSPSEVALTPEPQLLSLDDMQRRPIPRFIARLGNSPIIPAESLGVFYGRSEAFKSYFTVKFAAAIACGVTAFQGLTLDYPAGAWAIYVGAEDAPGLAHRIAEACNQLGADTARIRLINQPVVMTDMDAVLDLVRRIKIGLAAAGAGDDPVALIVLDTYNQTLGPGDEENSADTARAYTTGMRVLSRAFPASAVITVHHPNAEGVNMRGSTALENNIEFALRFDREDGTMRTTVLCKKQKNAAKFDPFALSFADSAKGIVLAGIQAGAQTRIPKSKANRDPLFDHEQKRLVFRALALGEPNGLGYSEWKKQASSAGTFNAAKSLMEDRGLVHRGDDSRYRLTTTGLQQAQEHGWGKTLF